MTIALPPPDGEPMSWGEFEALPSVPPREYVDGIAVTPAVDDAQHRDVTSDLVSHLRDVLPSTHRVASSWPWKPSDDEFLPDVAVWDHTGETRTVRFTGVPALAVEVLSSNRSHDLLHKLAKYAAAGLPTYWIVDPRERTLSVHVLDDSGVFRLGRVS